MIRHSWAAVSIVLCCWTLLVFSILPSPAQQPRGDAPVMPAQNWRYQMIGTPQNGLVLLDTQTGRAWSKFLNGAWEDLETPPSKEKK